MISDRHSTPGTSWSRLESLPPELLASITSNLAFFDKKALASTSHRLYDLMPPLVPPDRFAWRVHLCTAFNHAPVTYFDTSILEAERLREELKRLVTLTPETLRRGHYVCDPKASRLRDLGCLYFPTGFQTRCGDRQILCRTLGQFIAIQLEEFVARTIRVSRQREALALGMQPAISSSSLTTAQKKARVKEARHWKELQDTWKLGVDLSNTTLCPEPCVFCW
ncbi:MAG: hypothetical protein Q9183_005281, partial [Haloplaca sp. 2 TL-2023]